MYAKSLTNPRINSTKTHKHMRKQQQNNRTTNQPTTLAHTTQTTQPIQNFSHPGVRNGDMGDFDWSYCK